MKVFGEFQLKVKNVVTGEETDTGWRPNLVLNNAFNEVNSPYFSPIINLGTGSVIPTLADLTLETPLISTAASLTFEPELTTFVDPIYSTSSLIHHIFPLGAVDGNVSEIGLSASGASHLTTRALITDTNGDPTTIVVGVNDILTVNYRLGYEIDTSHPPGVSVVDFDGVNVDLTAKWVGLGKGVLNTNGMNGQSLPYLMSTWTQSSFSVLSTLPADPLNSMTDAVTLYNPPNGSRIDHLITSTGSSWIITFTFTSPINEGIGDWVGIVVGGSTAPLIDKLVLFEFSQPVTKAANQQFTITISYEIQRD